ncbi:MAG: MFS transporter [Ruminococcaceae bacterium]|nr:MFS transporter [Oscillospiraceae bacterium]MBQ9913085.1 MFS transporter [Clostridia bacterium]
MKTKEISAEKLLRQQQKREKEIAKWEKEKARPKRNYYFAYLVLIICIIYATDEIASQISTLMKTEIANDLFSKFGESSVGLLDILSILVVPFQALGLLYRPLADKWGRKRFLIINTFGMSFAMLVVFLSGNLVMYFIGACMVQFFIPHDMHVVYIMESSPAKNRARIYSVIKFFANMSVMLVPLLRRLLMADSSQWRNVYFIPAIVGIITSLIALLFAREPDTFIDSRLRYLKLTDEERAAQEAQKKAENAQGGLIPALKFAMKHRQLKWLYITSAIANLGFIGTINYQVIMSYGYAQNYFGNNLFDTLDAALEAVSIGDVTTALFMFPVGCAVSQVIMGFICDSKGRKAAAVTTAFNGLLFFVLFSVGSSMAFNPYVVGFCCGAFIGSYYSTNDVIIMMIGESSPTNLRSSTMSAQFIVTAVGVAVSYIISLPLITVLGNSVTGIVSFALLVPGFIAALVCLIRKTNETKGIDMDTVTGCEWD